MRAPGWLLGLAIGLALLVVFTGSGEHAPASASTAVATVPAEADAPVGALVLQRCGTCHGLDTLSHNPQDAAGWSRTVTSMQQLGAQISPQERDALVAYLARHFGPH
ncbi:MAG TPA: hypothetical protein VN709_00515 [Terriglobales bacterium]|nr:hypothetical protein [Terriglobales bacterium]